MSRSSAVRLSLILALALPAITARAQSAAQPTPPASGSPSPQATTPPASDEPEAEDITVTGQQGRIVTVLPGGREFISPMGEPFRSTDDLSGAEHWFRQADADDNGRITLEEFKADGFRFFASLDTDKSDDIGPQEMERYEEYVAPEVKVTSSWGDPRKAKVDRDGNLVEPPYPARIGAGRLAYLPYPQPVIYADANFDRGVDRREFNAAAETRFKMLDRNGDGALSRTELPRQGG